MNEFEILVNSGHLLNKKYKPNDLFILDNNDNNFHKYKDPTLKPMLRLAIKPYLDKMIKNAKLDNVEFIVDSGYRSFEYQEKVLNELIKEKGNLAYKLVAMPGASEHQTGLAFDIAYLKKGIYSDDVRENDKEVKWLMKNSYKYGFILRYPKGKENITGINFEPWHYRFVGIPLAKKLTENNITLEEYYK